MQQVHISQDYPSRSSYLTFQLWILTESMHPSQPFLSLHSRVSKSDDPVAHMPLGRTSGQVQLKLGVFKIPNFLVL